MPLAAFLAHLGLGFALALVARAIPSERRVLLHVLAAAAVLGIVAKVALVFFPRVGILLGEVDAFVWLERDAAIPFAVGFFALAAKLVDEKRGRRAVALMPWVLQAYLVVANVWTFTTPECMKPHPDNWVEGVCIQSTDYTCGAASIATLLRAEGQRDASEAEAARISHTIPYRGLDDLGAAMALRKKLSGRRVRIRLVGVDELAREPLPCLAGLRHSFWFDHMVVVLAADAGGFWLGDPLRGRVRLSKQELEERWLGRAIVVERP